MQASESANEQSSRAQGGSEPGRRGASRAMTADQVHAAAVVGERATAWSFCYDYFFSILWILAFSNSRIGGSEYPSCFSSPMPRTWLALKLSARALSVGTTTRRMTPPAVRMCVGTSIMSKASSWSMRLGKAPAAARCVCVRGRMSVLPARFLRGPVCHWIHHIFMQTRTRRRTHERFAIALLQEKAACAQYH